jgi:DNA-binding NarL/FixJ family response regulator
MAFHILVVDADRNASLVTCAFVQRVAPHATVTCESTPRDAWLSFQRTPPDVLVLDPSPYGPQAILLLQLLKQQHPHCRVVILASMPTPGLRRKLREMQVDAYLEKPAPLPLLAEQLRAMLAEPPAPIDLKLLAHA